MVNDESIHDRAKQQSVIVNLRAIKLKEQSDREYISEHGCAPVQYFSRILLCFCAIFFCIIMRTGAFKALMLSAPPGQQAARLRL